MKILLADLINDEQKAVLTSGKVIHGVAQCSGVHPEDVLAGQNKNASSLVKSLCTYAAIV